MAASGNDAPSHQPSAGGDHHDSLRALVRRALRDLNELPRLNSNDLARMLRREGNQRTVSAAQFLRDRIVAAIDRIQPVPSTPASSRAWRSYNLLTNRYVEGRVVKEVLRQIGVERSEYQREHARALNALVALLAEEVTAADDSGGAIAATPRPLEESLTPGLDGLPEHAALAGDAGVVEATGPSDDAPLVPLPVAASRRLARLDEETREVLAGAAVLGREFSFVVLQLISGRPEAALARMLGSAVALAVLQDRTSAHDERYAFVDPRVQEALYHGLPAPVRRRLHRAAGTVLESYPAGRPDGTVAVLAHHFLLGADPEKAAAYSLRAGALAEVRADWPEAERWYNTAFDLWQGGARSLTERAALADRLAEIARYLPDGTMIEQVHLQRAIALHTELGNQLRLEVLRRRLEVLNADGSGLTS